MRIQKIIKLFIILIIVLITIIFLGVLKKNRMKNIEFFCDNYSGSSFCQGGLEAIVSNKDNNENVNDFKKKILEPGDYNMKIIENNIERFYLLHIPKSYKNSPTSLILAFHGGMGSAEIQRDYYGWVEKSNKEGFIIAFPNGVSRFKSGKFATWNAGKCCAYAVESNSDDVNFVQLIIEDIKEKVNIDNIFATGMSNGGMFSYRLACEMSDTFKAIAAVAGTNNYDSCNPKNPISVMHIHGLLDDHVLFDGGCGPACKVKSETEFTSVSDTILDWVEKNNCDNNSERIFENENGYCDLYSQCKNDVQVELCVAEDGGHSWPGATLSPFSNALEKSLPSQAFSATDLIWDFFKIQ